MFGSVGQVKISAPARLHFGLFSVGSAGNQRLGGLGLMIRAPRTVVHCLPSNRLQVMGYHRGQLREIVRRVCDGLNLQLNGGFDELPLRIELRSCPPRHCGFGTGTQTALAVATAILRSLDIAVPCVDRLAVIMARGKRSMIGSHGFLRGGLLSDEGLNDGQTNLPLHRRLNFPPSWSIVTFLPRRRVGLYGHVESRAFEELAGKGTSHQARLMKLCSDMILPAVSNHQYQAFAEALFEFNYLNGLNFSGVQQGAYQSPLCREIVGHIREFGISAVGQSSWGPCIFAVAPTSYDADALVSHLQRTYPETYGVDEMSIITTSADNQGVEIQEELPRRQVIQTGAES
jgi:beta-RFAP synthase